MIGSTRALVRAPDAGIFDPIAWWAAHDPQRVALVEPAQRRTYTYGELDELSDRWRVVLAHLGATAGDRVAVLASNRTEYIPLLAAANRIGAMLVPLNWRLAAPELALVLADAAPSVLLGEERFRAVAEQAVALANVRGPTWCDLDRDVASLFARTEKQRGRSGAGADRATAETPAMLLYTSGSTGVPKGVIMPHRQLHWNAVATNVAWQLTSHDVGPLATPLFHTGGWGVFTLPLLYCGGCIVMFDAFDPDRYLDMLRTQRVTVAFGVPTQLELLRHRPAWGEPLPDLRWFIAGGAPCPERVRDAVWDAGYTFREGYGLTECGPNCFTTTNALARANPGTVGHPLPFLHMRAVDELGERVADNAIGELQLRGPQMFGGYFNAPERTADVMTADGWLRTGDLVVRRDDGVWAIRGRAKEMFISGGENVFPGEVEAALLNCTGVAEVSVVAVPDARWGEVGCAVVVRAPLATVTGEAITKEVRSRLAGYKVPRHVVFTDSLPKLGSGKIDRRGVDSLAQRAINADGPEHSSGRRGIVADGRTD